MLASVEQKLLRLEGRWSSLTEELDRVEASIAHSEHRAETCARAGEILHEMETTWRDRFQQGLGAVVSDGLTSIFEEPIEVKLITSQYRDATAIDLRVVQRGMELDDVEEAKGGSLVQPLALLLRVLLTVAVTPRLAPLLVLDEPFSMVSREYRPRVVELLRELHERLGIQFIIVTHEEEFLACADRAYVVHLVDDAARIEPLDAGEERT